MIGFSMTIQHTKDVVSILTALNAIQYDETGPEAQPAWGSGLRVSLSPIAVRTDADEPLGSFTEEDGYWTFTPMVHENMGR